MLKLMNPKLNYFLIHKNLTTQFCTTQLKNYLDSSFFLPPIINVSVISVVPFQTQIALILFLFCYHMCLGHSPMPESFLLAPDILSSIIFPLQPFSSKKKMIFLKHELNCSIPLNKTFQRT